MKFEVGSLTLFGIDIGRLGRWWWQGLSAGRAAEIVDYFLRPSPRILVFIEGSWLVIFRPERSGRVEVARLAMDAQADDEMHIRASLLPPRASASLAQLELVLPADRVLRKQLVLPAEARGTLREVVGYQLPRLTPFSLDKLYYDVVADEKAEGQLDVDILAVPCAYPDPLIERVEKATGLRVSRLGVEDVPGANLFGRQRVPGRWWRRLNLNSWLLILLLVAVVTAAIAPLLKERQLVIERKQEITALTANVRDLIARKENLEASLSGLNHIVAKRAGQPLPSEVLAELTRLVPDDIYITSLRIQGSNLTVNGFGKGVVDLISRLNESERFSDARFTAPVSRNAQTGLDQFAVSIQLVAVKSKQPVDGDPQ